MSDGVATRGRMFFALLLACCLPLAGCRKREPAARDELRQAGYAWTAEDWFRAARENRADVLKAFARGGFDPSASDAAGEGALHAAAAAGAQEAAAVLLDLGLPLDAAGGEGNTPLMRAVLADQGEMIRWLIRQGADPRARDSAGYRPMLRAAEAGHTRSVEALAPHVREDLDSALLLAALTGRTAVIDTLTRYGASIHARMEDGRTALMIAAENGHAEAVDLLMDLGASRMATDAEGRTAEALAILAGHSELAQRIAAGPEDNPLALESVEELAAEMQQEIAEAPSPVDAESGAEQAAPAGSRAAAAAGPAAIPLQDATLSASVAHPLAGQENASAEPARLPPLAMRHYRQRELPVEVEAVGSEQATLRISGNPPQRIAVAPGSSLPGGRLEIVALEIRSSRGKLNDGRPMDVSVVRVRDRDSGASREWIVGQAAHSHEPAALLEDLASGRRYLATTGARFRCEDGVEFLVGEIRPGQLVLEETATGRTHTLPLRGPRG